MNSSSREIINEIRYAVRARQILRWATISKQTKYSEHLSKEIDTRIYQNLKALQHIIWFDGDCATFVSEGAAHAMVSLLSSSKEREAENAAWTICRVASRDDACKVACISAGAIPVLVKMLSSDEGRVAELAIAILGNIVSEDDAEHKAACVNAGTLPALVRLMSYPESTNEALVTVSKNAQVERAVRALWNIAKGDDAYKTACLEAGAVPVLMRLLTSGRGNEEYASRALWCIARGDATCKMTVISALVKRMTSSKGREAERAAAALRNIVWENAAFKAACVEAGAIPVLVRLLSSGNIFAINEARDILKMIADHSLEYRQLVIDAGFNPNYPN
jgi:importin subunit alpha-2